MIGWHQEPEISHPSFVIFEISKIRLIMEINQIVWRCIDDILWELAAFERDAKMLSFEKGSVTERSELACVESSGIILHS